MVALLVSACGGGTCAAPASHPPARLTPRQAGLAVLLPSTAFSVCPLALVTLFGNLVPTAEHAAACRTLQPGLYSSPGLPSPADIAEQCHLSNTAVQQTCNAFRPACLPSLNSTLPILLRLGQRLGRRLRLKNCTCLWGMSGWGMLCALSCHWNEGPMRRSALSLTLLGTSGLAGCTCTPLPYAMMLWLPAGRLKLACLQQNMSLCQ